MSEAKRLMMPLKEAVHSKGLILKEVYTCKPDTDIEDVLAHCNGFPVVICDPGNQEIIGIATPFDLL